MDTGISRIWIPDQLLPQQLRDETLHAWRIEVSWTVGATLFLATLLLPLCEAMHYSHLWCVTVSIELVIFVSRIDHVTIDSSMEIHLLPCAMHVGLIDQRGLVGVLVT